MKSAETPADDLFLAAAENVPAERGTAARDSSEEVMARLRDPFTVLDGGASDAAGGETTADPSGTARRPGGNRRAARSPGRP